MFKPISNKLTNLAKSVTQPNKIKQRPPSSLENSMTSAINRLPISPPGRSPSESRAEKPTAIGPAAKNEPLARPPQEGKITRFEDVVQGQPPRGQSQTEPTQPDNERDPQQTLAESEDDLAERPNPEGTEANENESTSSIGPDSNSANDLFAEISNGSFKKERRESVYPGTPHHQDPPIEDGDVRFDLPEQQNSEPAGRTQEPSSASTGPLQPRPQDNSKVSKPTQTQSLVEIPIPGQHEG